MPLRPLGAELQVDMLITTTSAISGKLVFSDVRPKKKPYQQIASGKKKKENKQHKQAQGHTIHAWLLQAVKGGPAVHG